MLMLFDILRSPVTRWVAAVLLAAGLAVGWHNARVERAVDAAVVSTRAKLFEAFKAATDAELARQRAVVADVLQKAEARAQAAQTALANKQEEVDDIVSEIRRQPPGGCRMSPALLRRLRDLRD